MGVDWIPCRLDRGVAPCEAAAAIAAEHRRFCRAGGWLPRALRPLVEGWPPAECDPGAAGLVSDLVLLRQRASHRVSVVSGNPLLPLEWRLDSLRTLLPRELPSLFARWAVYLDSVAEGRYRGYVVALRTYECGLALAEWVADELEVIAGSRSLSADWAQGAPAVARRERILSLAPIEAPRPPAPDLDMLEGPALVDWAVVVEQRRRWVEELRRWNTVAGRKWRARLPPPPPGIETWCEGRGWFPEFASWVQPWIDGGYGLYRDCE